MIYLDNSTGQEIELKQYIKNQIKDVLTTPIGSRVMRRDYGSSFTDLIDMPLNNRLIMQIKAEIISAITKFIKTIKPISANFINNSPSYSIEINYKILATGEQDKVALIFGVN